MSWGSLLLLGLLIAGGVIAGVLWRGERRRNAARQILSADSRFTAVYERVDTFPPRFQWAAPLAALTATAICWQWLDWPMPLAAAAGGLIGVLGFIIESMVAARRILRLEMQLTEAIDGLVGSLRVGLALPKALDMAMQEAKAPLRSFLEDIVARLRLGDDAHTLFFELAQRIPLESVKLFTLTLTAQWATGGRIATSLAAVGRTIRDRIEVSRRVAAQAVEAQVSVAAMIGISYGLAWIMYRANPKPFVTFLLSDLGLYLIAGAMMLQGIGIFWVKQMSHIRY
jgi:tight adherence protein B